MRAMPTQPEAAGPEGSEPAQAGELERELQELRKQNDNLSVENLVHRVLSSRLPPQTVLPGILGALCKRYLWSWGALWTTKDSGDVEELALAAHWDGLGAIGSGLETASQESQIKRGAGLVGRAWETRGHCWSGDLSGDSTSRFAAARRAGLRCGFAFPVITDCMFQGVMEFLGAGCPEPDPALIQLGEDVARAVGDYLVRQRHEEELRESERRYRIMFKQSPIPFWLWDLETKRFLAVNIQATKTYGYTEEEFRNMSIYDLRPPEDVTDFKSFLDGVREGPTPLRQGRHRTKSGTVIDVETTSHPVRWSGRRARLVLANDVTERKRVERERDEMEMQLRHAQKMESIGQLAAGIAHEINTPIQYVGDNVQFLKDACKDLEPVFEAYQELVSSARGVGVAAGEVARAEAAVEQADLEFLREEMPTAAEQALEGVGRVSTLVKAMKEFSHPGHKGLTPTDLNHAIQNTVAVSRNEWKYVADVETHLDDGLPLVPCLPGEFNQVILNLIVNAAHAIGDCQAEKGRGKITIRTRKTDSWAEVQVEDTGSGIPPEAQPRVFDPFFTTKPVGKGTGQGLAISHSVIVDKHKGSIQFTSQPGNGTVFVIRIPLKTACEEADRSSSTISEGAV